MFLIVLFFRAFSFAAALINLAFTAVRKIASIAQRTLAKLAHLGRAPLEQIQISLGHASIQTKERYLGLKQNLHDAPCDRLGLVGWRERG